jgi:hypothetical protein
MIKTRKRRVSDSDEFYNEYYTYLENKDSAYSLKELRAKMKRCTCKECQAKRKKKK